MIKEFEVNDILNAVNSISKMKRKKNNAIEVKNSFLDKEADLTIKKQIKTSKSEVLVLNEMIE
tara:strand:- start:136 stop:324 length:189 start_codon:yes stop_codon:yes gene_type:complete